MKGALAGGLFSGVVGGVSSLLQMGQARKMRERAQKFIDNFEPIPLSNKFEGVQVSTLGSDMQAEAANEDFKTRNENARGGGMRGIMAMGQGNQTIKDKVTQQISAGLDAKQKELDVMAANDDVRIETIKEKRSQDELAGYGAMLNKGRDMGAQGTANLVSYKRYANRRRSSL